MMRILTRILSVILLGGVGGVLMVGILLPSLKGAALVHAVPFLQNIAQGTTVVQRTQQLVVDENSALEAAIQNAQKNIVQVQVSGKNSAATASGLVLTNDGVVVFPGDEAQANSVQYLVRGSGADWTPAIFLAKDAALGLMLVRAQDLHLTPVNFGDVQTLNLGQRIFAFGVSAGGQNFVADGIVTAMATDQKNGQTSLRLDAGQANGAGLFSLEGETFGMFVTQQKTISLVSSADIQGFLQNTLAGQ